MRNSLFVSMTRADAISTAGIALATMLATKTTKTP
jgi:hypothetical protein